MQHVLRPQASPQVASKMSKFVDARAPLSGRWETRGGSAVVPSSARTSPGTPRSEAWPRGTPQSLEVWTPGGYPQPLARRPLRPARPGAACPVGPLQSPSTPTLGGSSSSPATRWNLSLRPPAHSPGAGLRDNPRTPQKVPEVQAAAPDVADDTPPKGSKPSGQRRQPLSENSAFSAMGRSVGTHRKLPHRKPDSPVSRSPACKAKPEPLQDLTNLVHLRRNHSDVLHRPQKPSALQLQPGTPVGASAQAPAAAATPLQERPLLPSPSLMREPLPAPDPLLHDFAVVAQRYGAAAAARLAEDMPLSVRHALNFLKLLPCLPCTELGSDMKPLLPPRLAEEPPRPVLVLDLDETLVHCSREGKGRPQCQAEQAPDMVIEFEVTPATGSVYFRPFVHLFLEVAARSFEVVVFTASQQAYADKVINALDPKGLHIKHRLYRQHCTELRGAFFKELGLLGRPMGQCLLVDNSPISVACNADHGVLIRSWYGDRHDRELVDLLAVLQDLQLQGGDVSRYLSGRYGLREFFQAMRQGVTPP
uniref:FCP1 homology domain-containing protein n=1 Tax=Alexandrium monilatum TaxID=311494 RepID=A0A7S4RW55_9DINO